MYGKNYKTVMRKTTLGDAVSDAFSDIESLAGEMDEWKSSLEGTNFESSSKFESISAALECLEDKQPPDTDGFDDLEVEYAEGVKKSTKRRGASRAARLGNAVNALNAVIEVLSDLADSDEETDEDRKQNAGDLRDSLQEAVDEVDGVEFPGMFG